MRQPFIINAHGKLVDKESHKNLFLAKYLSTTQGRAKIAQSMIQPLIRQRDYQGIARKVFLVQQLPPGAQTYYYDDPDKGDR